MIETEVATTPKSAGFFSGLRNFFTRNSGATTLRPVTSAKITKVAPVNASMAAFLQPNIHPASPPQNARTRNGGGMPAQLPLITSTAKPSSVDDFPALSAPRRDNNNNRLATNSPTISSTSISDHGNSNLGSRHSTSHNAWIDIRHRGGNLRNLSMTTSTHRPSYSLPTSKSLMDIHFGGNSHHNNTNNAKVDIPLASDAEIESLSESLFEKSTPNIFASINVNLQGCTRSSEHTDQAPMP